MPIGVRRIHIGLQRRHRVVGRTDAAQHEARNHDRDRGQIRQKRLLGRIPVQNSEDHDHKGHKQRAQLSPDVPLQRQ